MVAALPVPVSPVKKRLYPDLSTASPKLMESSALSCPINSLSGSISVVHSKEKISWGQVQRSFSTGTTYFFRLTLFAMVPPHRVSELFSLILSIIQHNDNFEISLCKKS